MDMNRFGVRFNWHGRCLYARKRALPLCLLFKKKVKNLKFILFRVIEFIALLLFLVRVIDGVGEIFF